MTSYYDIKHKWHILRPSKKKGLCSLQPQRKTAAWKSASSEKRTVAPLAPLAPLAALLFRSSRCYQSAKWSKADGGVKGFTTFHNVYLWDLMGGYGLNSWVVITTMSKTIGKNCGFQKKWLMTTENPFPNLGDLHRNNAIWCLSCSFDVPHWPIA